MIKTLIVSLITLVSVVSCKKDESISVNQIPMEYWLSSSIAGVHSDTLDVSCECLQLINLDFLERSENGWDIYSGKMGGHFNRTVTSTNTGNGLSLTPDTYAEIEFRLSKDSVIIYAPINRTEESRFYDEFTFFKGEIIGNHTYQGLWSCFPFDIYEGGWVDTIGVISGYWELSPFQIED